MPYTLEYIATPSASNKPFRWHKIWVHEGGIVTPLIVHWPNGIKARGELRRDPGHVIDFVPTLLDLAGARASNTWNGVTVPAQQPDRARQMEARRTELETAFRRQFSHK